jgi:hypothetical protein
MSGNRSKGQHFVPRFYLANFVDNDGLVWTYDSKEDDVHPSTPEKTARQTNFYSTEIRAGEYNDALDHWLQSVEDKAANCYPKLLNGEMISEQEKADLAVFFSSLHTRSPAIINASAEIQGYIAQHASDFVLQDRQRFERLIDQLDKKRGEVTSQSVRDETFAFAIDKSRYVMEVHQKAGLSAMLGTDRLTDVFLRMTWIVFSSEHQHLIASDNPLVRVTPAGKVHPLFGDGGFLNKHVIVTVPLTPSRLLEMRWTKHPPGIYPAEKQQGRIYNRQRAYFAERYLYASLNDVGIRALARRYSEPGLRMTTSGIENLAPVVVKRRLR